MSDVKHWQFTLRGIIGYMTLACAPLGLYHLAIRTRSDEAGVASVATAGGIVGATLGWLIGGSATGFWIGYVVGCAAIVALLP